MPRGDTAQPIWLQMEGEETEDCGGGGAERYYMQGVQTIRGLRVQAGDSLNINNQEFRGRGRGELQLGRSGQRSGRRGRGRRMEQA